MSQFSLTLNLPAELASAESSVKVLKEKLKEAQKQVADKVEQVEAQIPNISPEIQRAKDTMKDIKKASVEKVKQVASILTGDIDLCGGYIDQGGPDPIPGIKVYKKKCPDSEEVLGKAPKFVYRNFRENIKVVSK